MTPFAASGLVQASVRMRSSFVPQRHFDSASCRRPMAVFELLARHETRTMTGGLVQSRRLRVWCMAVFELGFGICTYITIGP